MKKKVELKTENHEFIPEMQNNSALEYVADCARLVGYDYKTAVSNIVLIAGKNAYHPARDWVLSKRWDGIDRYNTLFDAVEQKPTYDENLKKKILRRWLRSCIALLMHTTVYQSEEHGRRGFKGVESVLVLQGEQGLSKTSFLQSLVPPNTDFFADGVALDPRDKDSLLEILSHWIVELGELDAIFRKTDISAQRAWITKTHDEIRRPYAREIERYPRRTSLCATVNPEEFLPEVGENRRYWVIAVNALKSIEQLDIQQLWAQAYDEYSKGMRFWFKPGERKEELYASNSQFERKPVLMQLLEQHVRDPRDMQKQPAHVVADMTLEELADLMPTGPKPPEPIVEIMNATQIYQRLCGHQAPKSRDDLSLILKWLMDKGFRSATNKHFHVTFVGLPDTAHSRSYD